MDRKFNKVQENQIDIKAIRKSLILKEKAVDLASELYKNTVYNWSNYIFSPDPSSTIRDKIHRFIAYDEFVVKVYSICEQSQKIKLEDTTPMPNHPLLPNKGLLSKELWKNTRKTHFCKSTNKLTIMSKSDLESGRKAYISFNQLDVSIPSTRMILLATSSSIHKANTPQETELILTNSDSPRAWIRNSLFEFDSEFSISQSYLSPSSKPTRPQVLLKIDGKGIHERLKNAIRELSGEKKQLYADILGFKNSDRNWKISKLWWRSRVQSKNINRRLYCLTFKVQKCFFLSRIFEKNSRKMIRKTLVNVGEIFKRALEVNEFFEEKTKGRSVNIIDFDLEDDMVILGGEINIQGKYNDFQLTTKNSLIRGTDCKYELKLTEETKPSPRKRGCFNNVNYTVIENKEELIINLYEKNCDQGLLRTVKISKERRLLNNVGEILDLGATDNQKLIYFRDPRFLYLLQTRTARVVSKVNYCSSKTLVQMDNFKQLSHGIFGKIDLFFGILELYKVSKGIPEYLKDINIPKLIEHTLNEKLMGKFSELRKVKMAGSRKGKISLICEFIATESKSHGLPQSDLVFIASLDVKTLKVEYSDIPSFVVTPKGAKLRYNPVFDNWFFDKLFNPDSYNFSFNFVKIEPNKLKAVSIKRYSPERSEKIRRKYRFISVYSHGERYYLEVESGRMKERTLTIFDGRFKTVKDEDGGPKLVGFELGFGRSSAYYDKEGQLKFFMQKMNRNDGPIEICLTNADLVPTHKLTLKGLPGRIRHNKAVVKTLPGLVGGNNLVVTIGEREDVTSFPCFYYLLNIDRLEIARIGLEQKDLEKDNSHEKLLLTAWDNDLLVLNNYSCYSN